MFGVDVERSVQLVDRFRQDELPDQLLGLVAEGAEAAANELRVVVRLVDAVDAVYYDGLWEAKISYCSERLKMI